MALGFRSEYEMRRDLGVSKRHAKRQALVASVRSAEQEVRSSIGDPYDEEHVRQSIVHTREDMVLTIAVLGEIADTARSVRRWVMGGVLLAVLYVWFA